MELVYKYNKNQPTVWFHKSKAKSNQYCLYCGVFVGIDSNVDSNKEHLIGRQFVPAGSFQDGSQFNFIFRACEKCNSIKSEIERHVSTVTMLNGVSQFDKPEYIDRAKSKASKDFHPSKPGILVKDASDKHVFKFKSGPINMTFEAISPPQVASEYIKALSFYHIQGLFSLITSKNPLEASGTNLLPIKNFWFHGAYNHGDWGNVELLEVGRRADKLRCRANIQTADGNFKAVLSQTIEKPGYWFWALEWNKHMRVIGGIYSDNEQPPIFAQLPDQKWKSLGIGSDGADCKIKYEIPLSNEDDVLFTYEACPD